MENTVVKLYQYIKDRYGIEGTEKENPEENIVKSFDFYVDGTRKNSDQHSWSAFIENGSEGEISLIIGERWPDEGTMWSRYLEVTDYQNEHFPVPFLDLIQNLVFNKDIDFATLRVFTRVFEEFFAENE